MDFTSLTDAELSEQTKQAAADMSHYNAAEGNSWFSEANKRARCRAKLDALSIELSRRNLAFPAGNFLL